MKGNAFPVSSVAILQSGNEQRRISFWIGDKNKLNYIKSHTKSPLTLAFNFPLFRLHLNLKWQRPQLLCWGIWLILVLSFLRWTLPVSLGVCGHKRHAPHSSGLFGSQGSRAMTLAPQQSRSQTKPFSGLSPLCLPAGLLCCLLPGVGRVALFFGNVFSYTDDPCPWNRE